VTDATKAERLKQYIEDQRRLRQPPEGTTLHQLAQVNQELGGRFAKADTNSGENPSVSYPPLPASSPWSGDYAANQPEPPLGVDISYVEPVGTAEEIERSLAQLSSPQQTTAPTAEAPISGVVRDRSAGAKPLRIRRIR
jgi:hypothetical protein